MTLRPAQALPLLLFLLSGAVQAQTPGDAPSTESGDGASLRPHWTTAGVLPPELTLPVARHSSDLSSFLSPQTRNWGAGTFSVPFQAEERQLDANRSMYSRALSIQWQHVDAENRYTVSAQRANAKTSEVDPATASGQAASVAWRRMLNPDTQVTSRLFLGDEESRERLTGQFGRRFYGMELEGRYSLWQRHAPFASFRWQHSDYDTYDSLPSLGNGGHRQERQSRFAAGWAWQALPNWDLKAQANLRLREDSFDPADNDRSQFYFSTQYGFR